jgi:hypothetical protein
MDDLENLRAALWSILPAGTGPLFGVPNGGTLRWILPEDRRAIAVVLEGWRPYTRKSGLKFAALKALIGLLGPQHVPGIVALNSPSGPGDARLEGVPVIYVGTPGTQRKAVIHLVREGAVTAIAKVALEPGGRAAVQAEAAMLEQLARELPDLPAPRLLSRDEDRGLTLQSVLPGMPCGRAFGAEHVEYLLRLRRAGQRDAAAAADPLLAFWNDAADGPAPELLSQWAQAGRGDMPGVWQHGDFAPWNLRRYQGAIAAYDWEAGKAEGLPLQDIAHFFAIQAYLFGEAQNPLPAMRANADVRLYLERMGLDWTDGLWLFGFYCLAAAREARRSGDDDYAGFLVAQFHREMAA